MGNIVAASSVISYDLPVPVTCKFESQMTQVVFEASTDIVTALVSHLREHPSTELTVNFVETREASGQAVVLQSPTGSTKIRVEHGRAIAQTTYFNGFVSPERWTERDDYFAKKSRTLLDALSACGVKLLMLGATTTVRIPNTKDADADFRLASHRAFAVPRHLVSDAEPYDFALRVSRVLDTNLFFNTHVGWYQSRSISVQVSLQGGPSLPRIPALWEAALEEEGIEIKYDWNNKAALFEGRRDWTADQLLNLSRTALEESRRVHDGLWRGLLREMNS